MKKKEKNLKEKSNIRASCISACIVMLIIVTIVVCVSNRKNVGIASRERENQESPRAISEVTAKTPNENSGTFHYEESSETGLDGNLIKVPVPTGYVGGCASDEMYVNGVTTEGVREHSGGYVIYEKETGETDEQARQAITADLATAQTTRNQYVWVPVSEAEVENMYKKRLGCLVGNNYKFTVDGCELDKSMLREPSTITQDGDHSELKQYMEGISKAEFLQEMREEFYEMLVSVKTYGGFYIGRYEVGDTKKKKVVIVKNNNQLGTGRWYTILLKARRLRRNAPVHTSIIWGIQFDETLKWLIESGEKTATEICSDSSSWGNYFNIRFKYTKDGQEKTKPIGSFDIIPSGSAEVAKANNIYDLAGNLYDATMEMGTYGNNRVYRGGSSSDQGTRLPASSEYRCLTDSILHEYRLQGNSIYFLPCKLKKQKLR